MNGVKFLNAALFLGMTIVPFFAVANQESEMTYREGGGNYNRGGMNRGEGNYRGGEDRSYNKNQYNRGNEDLHRNNNNFYGNPNNSGNSGGTTVIVPGQTDYQYENQLYNQNQPQ